MEDFDQKQIVREGVSPDYGKIFSEEELRSTRGDEKEGSSESRLERVQNYFAPSSQNTVRSDESQNRSETLHEKKLREAIQESITSGGDIGSAVQEAVQEAVHEYVLESIRCSADLWKSN